MLVRIAQVAHTVFITLVKANPRIYAVIVLIMDNVFKKKIFHTIFKKKLSF